MGRKFLIIDRDALLDIHNISSGTFSPLTGFLNQKDYNRVVNDMHLDTGQPWVMPITLDLPKELRVSFFREEEISLRDQGGKDIAVLSVEDIFEVNPEDDVKKIYGTPDTSHPGVMKEMARSRFRIGGRIKSNPASILEQEHLFTPDQTKEVFRRRGWKTITGFQTRNPIHRAHEHLQRLGLKATEGLFINPLIGWKKEGDFSPTAIVKSYECMIEKFYSPEKVFFGILRTAMRYAGPREAVFHAQIRKNFGCTHFIVGRDHAGVGNLYGKYAAHSICDKFDNLGIEIMKMSGPFYCKQCKDVTTEDACSHSNSQHIEISGTLIREMIKSGKYPPEEMIRKEIAEILLGLRNSRQVFYEEVEL